MESDHTRRLYLHLLVRLFCLGQQLRCLFRTSGYLHRLKRQKWSEFKEKDRNSRLSTHCRTALQHDNLLPLLQGTNHLLANIGILVLKLWGCLQ